MQPGDQWVMDEPGYGRTPRVCTDGEGRLWVVWISWTEKGECVRACRLEADGIWAPSFACSPVESMVTGVAAAPWGHGIIVSWIDGGDGENSGLKIREIDSSGEGGPVHLVVPARRSPADLAMGSGPEKFIMVWTVSAPAGRRLEGYGGPDPCASTISKAISQGPGMYVNPAVAVVGDEGWVAWQSIVSGESRIIAGRLDGPRVEVSRLIEGSSTGGIAAMPHIIGSAEGGLWVAWQSDLDPQDGPGLVRWIQVAHLDRDGRVKLPVAPMTGIDRDGRGEDQGFESPQLTVGPDGRLVVIGRGSQSLNRQDLGRSGWSERTMIGDGGWKCRGSHYVTCVAREGIFVAGRETEGIVVRLISRGDSSHEGEPELGVPCGASTRSSDQNKTQTTVGYTIDGYRVLFGDIHQHTMMSDGTGTPEETYLRARYRYGDDICAIADHESFLGKRTPPGEWSRLNRIADEAYEPGAFVTLHAFEWTGAMHPGPGHKVGYLPPRGGPILSRDDGATRDTVSLMETCRRVGALMFPHHVGWTGADMQAHDPSVQTCWEIVSCHGAYERPGVGPIGTRGDDKDGQFVAHALDAGLRFGFVGGSDGHGLNWHHGVCRMKDSHRSGLTAVLAQDVTRDAVFEALKNRRCYATSGARIGLWFEIAGMPMGEEIPVTESVSFTVIVKATSEISTLSLVTNLGREISLEAGTRFVEARGTLPVPPEGRWAYYYVRVVQEDGHVAWSSPIWLDAPGSCGSGLPAA